jgi:hypothetical protein
MRRFMKGLTERQRQKMMERERDRETERHKDRKAFSKILTAKSPLHADS